MKRIVLAILAAVMVAFAAPQTHDGLYVNSTIGYGYLGLNYNFSERLYGEDYTLDIDYGGAGVEFDFKIGAHIINNFILHITFVDVMKRGKVDVTETYDDETFKFKDKGLMTVSFLGIGGSYYLPSNVFFTGSVGMAEYSFGSHDIESDHGFAFQVGAGKEWWVSAEWAVGVMLAYTHTAGGNDSNEEVSSNSVQLMVTMTLN